MCSNCIAVSVSEYFRYVFDMLSQIPTDVYILLWWAPLDGNSLKLYFQLNVHAQGPLPSEMARPRNGSHIYCINYVV